MDTAHLNTKAKRVAYVIQHAELSIEEVTRLTGVSNPTVDRWLSNQAQPYDRYLEVIASQTDFAYRWLRDGTGPVKKGQPEPEPSRRQPDAQPSVPNLIVTINDPSGRPILGIRVDLVQLGAPVALSVGAIQPDLVPEVPEADSGAGSTREVHTPGEVFIEDPVAEIEKEKQWRAEEAQAQAEEPGKESLPYDQKIEPTLAVENPNALALGEGLRLPSTMEPEIESVMMRPEGQAQEPPAGPGPPLPPPNPGNPGEVFVQNPAAEIVKEVEWKAKRQEDPSAEKPMIDWQDEMDDTERDNR